MKKPPTPDENPVKPLPDEIKLTAAQNEEVLNLLHLEHLASVDLAAAEKRQDLQVEELARCDDKERKQNLRVALVSLVYEEIPTLRKHADAAHRAVWAKLAEILPAVITNPGWAYISEEGKLMRKKPEPNQYPFPGHN